MDFIGDVIGGNLPFYLQQMHTICKHGTAASSLSADHLKRTVDGRRKLTKTSSVIFLGTRIEEATKWDTIWSVVGLSQWEKKFFERRAAAWEEVHCAASYCIDTGGGTGHMNGLLGKGSTGNTPECERKELLLAQRYFPLPG